MHVLVVDDDEDTRTLLCMGLQRFDITSESAADTAEARTWLARGGFDAVLTDWRLSDGTAREIIAAAVPLRVVLLSGDMRALEHPWPEHVRTLKKPADLVRVVKALEP